MLYIYMLYAKERKKRKRGKREREKQSVHSFLQLNSLDERVIIARISHATLFIHRFHNRKNCGWYSCVANEVTSAPSETI